jgi:hypothetical protein
MVDFTPQQSDDATDTDQTFSNPVFADIENEWHWVKQGVEDVLKADSNLTFTPEHVYGACKAEQAVLWMTDEGFVVSTGETDVFNGERTFLIWLAWAKERGTNLAVKHLSFFEEVAKAAGFTKIETRSAVPKVISYLEHTGWEVDTVVFKRYL